MPFELSHRERVRHSFVMLQRSARFSCTRRAPRTPQHTLLEKRNALLYGHVARVMQRACASHSKEKLLSGRWTLR